MKFCKNRKGSQKGISPLVATVFLVVFVIGISAMILVWIQDYTTGTTIKASESSDIVLDCSSTNVNIDSIFISNNSGTSNTTIRVVVSNVGQSPLKLYEVAAWNLSGGICYMNLTKTVINVGESITVSNSGCEIYNSTDCSDFYKIKVSTTCGGINDEVKTTKGIICNGVILN